ncbi:MAG: decarboxylase [Tildeniella nuda ZEHNDER 1965/U140]|jgi:diaminopimelate decarboxylase|nr:decarboxylase [Tildeniella nuda ZEHNDER 1965/U140]
MVAVSAPSPPFCLELATQLLTTYGSPLYVYEGDRLRQTIRHITQSILYPQTRFHFASVTNGNIALLQIFRESGWGLHANTPGDIYLGLHAGFHPSQIIYSGSNLDRAEMAQVLRWGVTTLNLDSLAQLQLCGEVWRSLSEGSANKVEEEDTAEAQRRREGLLAQNVLPLRIGLRLNFPALTGKSRIGVHPDDFPTAVNMARQAGLKISGLHFYKGTGTNATTAFTEAIAIVLATASQLPDWTYLDFGGGFGYPYHHDGVTFDWHQFGAALSDRLSQLDRPIDLVIEPGRAAIASCATLLTQVVSVKWQNSKQIVGVDTTVANLSVPSVHGGYREIAAWQEGQKAEGRRQKAERRGQNAEGRGQKAEGRADSESTFLFTPSPPHPLTPDSRLPTPDFLTNICGNTTYSRDYLGKNCQLPALKTGDILAILDVGAYGYAMSSHFLHRPRPAEVLLENKKHRLIRTRESYSTLIENQVF